MNNKQPALGDSHTPTRGVDVASTAPATSIDGGYVIYSNEYIRDQEWPRARDISIKPHFSTVLKYEYLLRR
jgi:hypothetical protein